MRSGGLFVYLTGKLRMRGWGGGGGGRKIKIVSVGDDQRWEWKGFYSETSETALVLSGK